MSTASKSFTLLFLVVYSIIITYLTFNGIPVSVFITKAKEVSWSPGAHNEAPAAPTPTTPTIDLPIQDKPATMSGFAAAKAKALANKAKADAEKAEEIEAADAHAAAEKAEDEARAAAEAAKAVLHLRETLADHPLDSEEGASAVAAAVAAAKEQKKAAEIEKTNPIVDDPHWDDEL